MKAQYENMVNAAKNEFVKNFAMLKQDEEEQFFATLVKIYNRFCSDDNDMYQCIYEVGDKRQFTQALERADEDTFNQLCKARSMGAQYVWQEGDGLMELQLGRLAEVVADEFEKIFDYAMMSPQEYADFISLCFSVNMYECVDLKPTDSDKAPEEITINGKTYNKCYFGKQQWEDVYDPCAYCHEAVQGECLKSKNQCCFCRNEHVCYIDLADVLG